jgi:hypothetical protein
MSTDEYSLREEKKGAGDLSFLERKINTKPYLCLAI